MRVEYFSEINPIDVAVSSSVIKTRMQSLEARQQYRNSFHCGYRIFTEEGILRFWTGTTPRLVRLMVSGTNPARTWLLS
jgi:hypothetical protein